MQSIYTAGVSNYSMANLYRPAGIVNVSSSYLPIKGDVMSSAPTQLQTSVALKVVSDVSNTFEKTTNTLPAAQHIDYNQNPSAIQCLDGGNTPSTPRGTSRSTGTHF
jgi:hypothetical protein